MSRRYNKKLVHITNFRLIFYHNNRISQKQLRYHMIYEKKKVDGLFSLFFLKKAPAPLNV